MSYLVLARKYRPATFSDVVGQAHITELLEKAITGNKVSHAYLFCGPRGIGKTSCARILAKSLNCVKGPTLKPCGDCPSCKEISQGSGFDVIEIDGASNRGIDEIRTLRENVKFAPSYGKYKIYIVDEVHMLTAEAFNALLKTLEEPPSHAKFIFATTEAHKLPATIISRCQRYDFKRISLKTLVESLRAICEKERFTITDEALYAIAKASQGSFRDSLSILDQVSALSERKISDSDVYSMLGLVEVELLFALTDALEAKDCAKALEVLDTIMEKGKDIKQLARDLVEHYRNVMVMKVGGKSLEKLVDYSAPLKEQYYNQAQKCGLPDILEAIDEFIKAQETSRITETLRTPLEIAFARLTYDEQRTTNDEPRAANFDKRPATTVQRPASSVQRPEPNSQSPVPRTSSPESRATNILKDNKGSAILTAPVSENEDPAPFEDQEIAMPETAAAPDLEKIRSAWDALTYAVSREKMSLATFLQEGRPMSLKGERLTIGFAPEHAFHKEALERKDAVLLVERIFSEKLRAKILIEYKMATDVKPEASSGHGSHVQNALETFKGKIVSKWHNE